LIMLGALLLAALASCALYLFLLGAPLSALVTWIVIGGIIGLILGATSGRQYGFLHGLLAGIAGAALAAALFQKVRPEGGAITFTRAAIAGAGAAFLTLLARLLPGAKDPDVA